MRRTVPEALPGETEREFAWRVFPADAREILDERAAPTRRCGQSLCGAPLWWGYTAANARRCPFDIKPDGTRVGTSHWRTCRDRPKREPAPPKQRKPPTSRTSPERIAELRDKAREQIGLPPKYGLFQ